MHVAGALLAWAAHVKHPHLSIQSTVQGSGSLVQNYRKGMGQLIQLVDAFICTFQLDIQLVVGVIVAGVELHWLVLPMVTSVLGLLVEEKLLLNNQE